MFRFIEWIMITLREWFIVFSRLTFYDILIAFIFVAIVYIIVELFKHKNKGGINETTNIR